MVRRLGWAAVAAALTVTVLAVPPTPVAHAEVSDKPVEIAEKTTPTTQVFANPNGSFTMVRHAVPVRGRKDGRWAPLDTSLRFGGRVTPNVGAADVSFSAGGTDALVRLAEGERKVEMTWPAPLPRPELTNDVALYREVLPGVDLKLRALKQGYAKALVVKNRQAADNPRLRELQFGLRTSGVSVRHKTDGTLAAEDKTGHAVFRSGAARMWDATKKESAVAVEVADDHISLKPDLSSPDTKFPVEIDPDWGVGVDAWAMVYGIPSRLAGQSFWNGDGDDIVKVGWTDRERETVQVRSYFQFDVSDLAGKHILDAEFNILENWADSCTPQDVVLHETGEITPGTTWNNQPWIGQVLGVQNVAAGWSTACPAAWVGFDVAGAVNNSLASRISTTTMMLKAGDENDRRFWKKFSTDSPSLVVQYNTVPDVPTVTTVDGRDCGTVPAQPYIFTTGPRLRAVASDEDGESVRVKFQWNIRNGVKKGETTTQPQSPGTTFGVTIPPSDFQDGDTISYRARTSDDTDWSPWSAWCDATIDRTKPDKPPLVSSTDYPEDGFGGGIGQTGRFTFRPNGVPDVVAYLYDLHDQPQRRIEAGADGTATALVTPQTDDPQDLWVRSVDRAGNVSDLAPKPYHFRPGAGTSPVARWSMDNFYPSVDVLDSSGHGVHGKMTSANNLPSGGWWTVGKLGDALLLDGTTGHVSTSGPAIRTDSTFTVSAWARPESIDGDLWHTVVSQDGTNTSGFYLQLTPGDHKWNFVMRQGDMTGDLMYAVSAKPAVAGRWTHLAASFDRSTGLMTLYVDGVPQTQTAIRTTPWNATGPVRIGRAMENGQPTDWFHGAVDEVRMYDRLLSARELHDLATTPATDEGFWQLEGNGADASGNERSAVSLGGATWTTGAVGKNAVRLDGLTGQLDTGTQAVRTDTSFTVSARVLLTNANNAWQTAVSQDGPKSSGFELRYRPDTKRWSFAVSAKDAAAPTMISADSPQSAETDEWTTLVGVYDAADRQVRLYVNSALVASTPVPADTVMPAIAGNLVLGRGKLAGAAGRFFGGAIDHVHVYSGVRTQNQIEEDSRTPATPAPSVYDGQFSRWVLHTGEQRTTMGTALRGYHYEGPLGFPAPDDAPNTKILYSCLSGVDGFVTTDPGCEGKRLIAQLGRVYATPPAGVPTISIYRCVNNGSGDGFLTEWPNCDGQKMVALIGYARAYGALVREVHPAGDRRTALRLARPGYQTDIRLGYVVLANGLAGTTPLTECRNGTDVFLSLQTDCAGKQVVMGAGSSFDVPSADTVELLRCKDRTTNELFESTDPGCQGQILDTRLGHIRSTRP